MVIDNADYYTCNDSIFVEHGFFCSSSRIARVLGHTHVAADSPRGLNSSAGRRGIGRARAMKVLYDFIPSSPGQIAVAAGMDIEVIKKPDAG